MSSPDRIAQLEQRIAELEGRGATDGRRRRRGVAVRIALIGLVLALIIPAGVVLANHQFSDVPTGSSIHDDVEALVEAGVTSGCGGGKYCPADSVTRGQMAQFLNRLGALDGQTPSVNADRVDGRNANALIRVASWGSADTTAIPVSGAEVTYGPDLVITAPAAGFVTINMGVTVLNSSCTTTCWVSAWIHHNESTAVTFPNVAAPNATDEFGTIPVHGVFAVQAGVNSFELRLNRSNAGNNVVYAYYATGNAIYSPFGSTGGSTLGVDSPEVDAAKLEP